MHAESAITRKKHQQRPALKEISSAARWNLAVTGGGAVSFLAVGWQLADMCQAGLFLQEQG
jgi:hypothetical protein